MGGLRYGLLCSSRRLFDRTTGPLNPPDPVDVVAGVSLLVHILGIAISILMVAVLVLIVNVALRALTTA
jgi:hypothetical protein